MLGFSRHLARADILGGRGTFDALMHDAVGAQMLDAAERIVRAVCGVAGSGVLAYANLAILRAVRIPAAVEETGARRLLRPAYLVAATVVFVSTGVLFWRPLPLEASVPARVTLLTIGTPLYLGGLTLYLVGMRALGDMFAPSSGFGVRLQPSRRLVTHGVFAHVRHPMYLGVIVTMIGMLMLYRTWTALLLAVMMFGLIVRARREDTVLAREFGDAWEAYAAHVPGWLPHTRGFR